MLAKGLREQAYAVDVAGDGRSALFHAGTTDYDAVILDVMLPDMDGLSVCRRLRSSSASVPILMLTARDAVEARIAGARQRRRRLPDQAVRLRRAARPPARAHPPRRPAAAAGAPDDRSAGARHAGARGDQTRRPPAADDPRVRAARILRAPRRRGRRPRRHRRARVGRLYDPLSNVIDVYVQRLRRKIDDAGGESMIRTRRGEGYALTPPE